jgi:T4 superinfection immunity protein
VELLIVLVVLCLYFLPSSIAVTRKVNPGGVIVVNLFLGWTFLGWIIALAWAFSGDPKPRVEPRRKSLTSAPSRRLVGESREDWIARIQS